MDIKLQKLTQEFSNITDLEETIRKNCSLLEGKIKILSDYYLSMDKYTNKYEYVFGIDSFRFQSRMINLEYDDIKRLYASHINRMYGEYFKLYKIISKIIKTIDNNKLNAILKANNYFPIYKDLEPFKKYEYKLIIDLHDVLLLFINGIIAYNLDKINELNHQKQKQELGLNINNFIFTFESDNKFVDEKICLFINYITFFHELHLKYMTRFLSKINLFISQINHDITFDDSIKSINIRRKSILQTFKEDNINETLIKDIKNTMNTMNNDSPKSIDNNIDTDYNINNNIDETHDITHVIHQYISHNVDPSITISPINNPSNDVKDLSVEEQYISNNTPKTDNIPIDTTYHKHSKSHSPSISPSVMHQLFNNDDWADDF